MKTSYTAYRNGHVFVNQGTWDQVEKVLAIGYCVASREYRADGSVGLGLGLLLGPRPTARPETRDESRHVVDGYNVEFQGARPAVAGADY